MFSAEYMLRFVKKGDPLYELEMFIENFPLARRKTINGKPEEEEWGLFKHSMRNALAVADERPEILSRLKAGMLLWNQYAGRKVWEQVDDDEYKDIEPWSKSLNVEPDLIADSMGKMILYEDMVERAKNFRQILEERRAEGNEQKQASSSSSSGTAKDKTQESPSKKQKAASSDDEEEGAPIASRTRRSSKSGASSSSAAVRKRKT